MVIDTDGYIELIGYLAENLHVFDASADEQGQKSIEALLDDCFTDNIMSVCQQHDDMSEKERFDIVRETDAVLNDLHEVLSSVLEQPATKSQEQFIVEFVSLIKNLFDSQLSR